MRLWRWGIVAHVVGEVELAFLELLLKIRRHRRLDDRGAVSEPAHREPLRRLVFGARDFVAVVEQLIGLALRQNRTLGLFIVVLALFPVRILVLGTLVRVRFAVETLTPLALFGPFVVLLVVPGVQPLALAPLVAAFAPLALLGLVLFALFASPGLMRVSILGIVRSALLPGARLLVDLLFLQLVARRGLGGLGLVVLGWRDPPGPTPLTGSDPGRDAC